MSAGIQWAIILQPMPIQTLASKLIPGAFFCVFPLKAWPWHDWPNVIRLPIMQEAGNMGGVGMCVPIHYYIVCVFRDVCDEVTWPCDTT